MDYLTILKAYQYYRDLGPNRSLLKVSQDLQIPLPTLKEWSRRYGWGRRVQESDETGGLGAEHDSLIEFLLEEVLAIRRVLRNNFTDRADKLKYDINTPRELETLIRIQERLEERLIKLMEIGIQTPPQPPSGGAIVELQPLEELLADGSTEPTHDTDKDSDSGDNNKEEDDKEEDDRGGTGKNRRIQGSPK